MKKTPQASTGKSAGRARLKTTSALIAALLMCAAALSPREAFAGELFFTYAGLAAGGGMAFASYSEWDNDRLAGKSEQGGYFTTGPVIAIFVKYIIGEFSIQYMNNFLSESGSVQHLHYTALGKYFYNLNETVYLSAGAGIYFESPPSNGDYSTAAGLKCTLGAGYSLFRDWRVMTDFVIGYGYYGVGTDRTKLHFGLNVAAVYKVGRL